MESECDLTNEHPCSDLSADGNEVLPGSSDTDELSTPELCTPELDLETCKSVKFKMQEDTSGVGYVTASGDEGWMPVGPRRKYLTLTALTKTTFTPPSSQQGM